MIIVGRMVLLHKIMFKFIVLGMMIQAFTSSFVNLFLKNYGVSISQGVSCFIYLTIMVVLLVLEKKKNDIN